MLQQQIDKVIRLLFDIRVNYGSELALRVVEGVTMDFEAGETAEPMLITGYEAELFNLLDGVKTPEGHPLWFELWLALHSVEASGESPRGKLQVVFRRLEDVKERIPAPTRRERIKQKAKQLVMLG